MSPPNRKKVAMVLSGGGARGAYEVGVLSYVLDTFAEKQRRVPKVDILSGTSVGAINACYLAAHMAEPTAGVRHLVNLWTTLELDRVLRFGPMQALKLPKVLLGGGKDSFGIFDVSPMAKLIEKEIPWRGVSKTLRRRYLEALTVSATEVSTGRTVIFMQTGPSGALPTSPPPRTIIRAAHIGPPHALASAAIPILFPHVRLGSELYMDGGVRQNTPIAPSLRLGATHVFGVGMSREVRGISSDTATPAPGAAFVLGKVLNAFMLDHIQQDIDTLDRVNEILVAAQQHTGDAGIAGINQQLTSRGKLPVQRVESLILRPSEDIGRMAAHHVRRGPIRGSAFAARKLLTWMDVGEAAEADLASYLLFDGAFAQKLIELGRADAAARRDEVEKFFEPPPEADRSDIGEDTEWSTPPPPIC